MKVIAVKGHFCPVHGKWGVPRWSLRTSRTDWASGTGRTHRASRASGTLRSLGSRCSGISFGSLRPGCAGSTSRAGGPGVTLGPRCSGVALWASGTNRTGEPGVTLSAHVALWARGTLWSWSKRNRVDVVLQRGLGLGGPVGLSSERRL